MSEKELEEFKEFERFKKFKWGQISHDVPLNIDVGYNRVNNPLNPYNNYMPMPSPMMPQYQFGNGLSSYHFVY